MRKDKVGYRVVGLLGGATPQAVYKSGNAFKWIQSRVRRMLLPSSNKCNHKSYDNLYEKARSNAKVYMKDLFELLGGREGFRVRKGSLLESKVVMGRPRKDSPRDLAEFLGVRYESGMEMFEVFKKFVSKMVSRLAKLLPLMSDWDWLSVQKRVDKEFPRWVNKVYGLVPSHLRGGIKEVKEEFDYAFGGLMC